MDIFECIEKRRSVRNFNPNRHVEWDKVGQIIEAGIMAPSSGNLQNWKFVVVEDKNHKHQVANACLQQFWIEKAQYIIIVVGLEDRAKRFYGIRGERFYSIQNCAACIQNMLLAAHSLGLGACWVGAFDEVAIRKNRRNPDLWKAPGNNPPWLCRKRTRYAFKEI